MKNIYFFVESIFNKRDYRRFGIDILNNKGHCVEVVDFSPLLRPKYFNNYSPPDPISYPSHYYIHTKNDFIKFSANIDNQSKILLLISYKEKSEFIYNYIINNNLIFGYLCLGSIPTVRKINVKKKIFNAIFNLKDTVHKLKRMSEDLAKVKPSPTFVLVGGKKAGQRYINSCEKIIKAHSADYDLFLDLEKNKKKLILDEYAVFLDEYAPYHPDSLGRVVPDVLEENYFQLLNGFFGYLERVLKIKIVIAAHPRSHYQSMKNPFENRVIYIGETISLVRDANFVLSHCSTSLSFAVLYRKPVLFLTHSSFSHWYKEVISSFALAFGKKPIDLSPLPSLNTDDELIINSALYDNYKEMYIKETGTPEKPIWEICADYLEESYTQVKQYN